MFLKSFEIKVHQFNAEINLHVDLHLKGRSDVEFFKSDRTTSINILLTYINRII